MNRHTEHMLVATPPAPSSAASATRVLDLASGRWRVEVLFVLAEGPRRFNELLRALEGLSGTVLARVLRALEHEGLVARNDGYAITPLGESLVELLNDIAEWGRTNLEGVAATRHSW